MSEKKYLFITGCPRSGTSALWRIITSHPKIMLGMERFSGQMVNHELSPELYREERFYNIMHGDTSVGDSHLYLPAPEMRHSVYKQIVYIGDKLPYLYLFLDTLAEKFSGAKVVFINRNIFDLATSYNARAEDSNDLSWNRDMRSEKAIRHWTDALTKLQSIPSGVDLACVNYESIFYQNSNIKPIFDFLGLDFSSEVVQAHQEVINNSKNLENIRRERKLSSNEIFNICTSAPFELYRQIAKKAIC
jgi:hypothetical protein